MQPVRWRRRGHLRLDSDCRSLVVCKHGVEFVLTHVIGALPERTRREFNVGLVGVSGDGNFDVGVNLLINNFLDLDGFFVFLVVLFLGVERVAVPQVHRGVERGKSPHNGVHIVIKMSSWLLLTITVVEVLACTSKCSRISLVRLSNLSL